MFAFEQHYKSRFSGILRWAQLEALWEKVQAQPDGWYVYCVGDTVPQHPVATDYLSQFIEELDELLRYKSKGDFCGLIYADNVENPAMIKVFTPQQLGSGCQISQEPIIPRWLLSKIPPHSLDKLNTPKQKQFRWWQNLFS
ncbi:hypothetical protein BegalDRAFT_1790 [Beggiatoa alba B18LD]|uniref:Uncharacterized protein n=1 Tax=Beggiatoa alba B18LD TaxID=395493 RepID=I3CGC1_9GAMM|nr:hypothetical protein [Beggiatoa alba]EIJ42664.1 hypothetical protein BegalDRAFT_1790 [Beggiatoa alba B18LD]